MTTEIKDYVLLKKLSYCTFLHSLKGKMYIIKRDEISNNEHIKEIIIMLALNRGIDYVRKIIDRSNDPIQIIGSIKKNNPSTQLLSFDNDNNDISTRVPDFIESFTQNDSISFVSNHVGDDMYDYVTKHRIPGSKKCIDENICKQISIQICEILQKLHKSGIAHCDMSLENLCANIDYDGTCDQSCDHNHPVPYIRIIDFGFSLVHHTSPLFDLLIRRKQSKRIIISSQQSDNINEFKCSISYSKSNHPYGKLIYMSPERLRANNYYGSEYCVYKDDIYAIGIMIFVIIMGFPPFDPQTDHFNLSKLLDKDRWFHSFRNETKQHIRNHISDDGLELIFKILKPEQQRITIEEILEHQWFKKQPIEPDL
jgi:serine/threonine protein kinase